MIVGNARNERTPLKGEKQKRERSRDGRSLILFDAVPRLEQHNTKAITRCPGERNIQVDLLLTIVLSVKSRDQGFGSSERSKPVELNARTAIYRYWGRPLASARAVEPLISF